MSVLKQLKAIDRGTGRFEPLYCSIWLQRRSTFLTMRGSSLIMEALEKKLLKALRRSLCRSCLIVPETL